MLLPEGTVDIKKCKDNVLHAYGTNWKAADSRDTLRDFLGTEEFDKFIKLLKEDVQKEPSIEAFRDARERTLKNIEQIQKKTGATRIGLLSAVRKALCWD